jgi:NAD(P)H-hydrate epimerase
LNLGYIGVIIYSTVKSVSVVEMQELDRKTIEDIGIPSIALMENAGRCVAESVIDMLGGLSGKRIAVFCGTGNNGGDGFVAARYLKNHGISVDVYIAGEKSRIKNDPLANLKILEKLGVGIKEISSAKDIEADLVIDAIFGIGLKGEIKEPVRSIIADLNKRKRPLLSVDVPSGLNADNGEALGEAIKATRTVTMQFPKKGFYLNKGPEYTGEVIVADIGIIG